MNNETFNRIVELRLHSCKTVLVKKNKEYSSKTDRLHNFKVAAKIDGDTPEEALWGMFKKHLVSVIDMKNDPSSVTRHLLDEKIGDCINYLLLLEALFVERIDHMFEEPVDMNHLQSIPVYQDPTGELLP